MDKSQNSEYDLATIKKLESTPPRQQRREIAAPVQQKGVHVMAQLCHYRSSAIGPFGTHCLIRRVIRPSSLTGGT